MVKKHQRPVLTYFLIILCVVIYLLEFYFQQTNLEFYHNIFYDYGFSLQNIINGKLWVLITSIFVHGSLSHLVLNMIAFYFFGSVVESELGKNKFLFILFFSAIFGNLAILASVFLGLTSAAIPTVGASAAIFGLMGVSMLIKPLKLILYPYIIPIPLILVALVFTLYNITTFLLFLSGQIETETSYASHIGGLISGMLLGFKEEESKKSFIILIFILSLLLFIPFFMRLLQYLEMFNYIKIISGIFG